MTRKEREALQNHMNLLSEVREEADRLFKELQKLSKEAGLPVYCCAKTNRDQLHRIDYKAGRADYLYEEYNKARGKEEILMEYGRMLAELNFWKNN